MEEKFTQHFQETGFKKLTAIQTEVAEPLAAGKSVLGIAPTGSGKTLAFTWPLLPRIEKDAGIQLLVLEPSQELAMQTTRVMRDWARLLDLHVQSLTGGANLRRQSERLKKTKPEIIVGTPGRILHLIDERDLNLKKLKTLVIDEADDLLVDDTQAVVEDIERTTPIDSQLAFFSATYGKVFDQLNDLFGRHIEKIDVRQSDDSQGPVKHALVKARTMSQKAAMLERLSKTKNFRALVFFSSIKTLHYTASRLKHAGVSSATLGGKQRQTERAAVMRGFRKHQIKLLLTTDVAARGLDLPKLPAVVNFELPTSSNLYIHRSGRTGRQGEPGLVINLGDDHDFRDLRRLLAKTDYQLVPMAIAERELLAEDEAKVRLAKEKFQKSKKPSTTKDQNEAHSAAQRIFAKAKVRKKNRKNKGIRLKHRRKAEAAVKKQK
ncbi:DEAD/DEAH box helicase [Lactobacillus alvi]|uniref:DEAD/DEAH box helicase n=1 Tax=Limosilactobacillus alvi TaxID=990412 RepID=A0ABS2EPQ1_9LACO|nr:DEAD/DEAH box helicase [Limosilactobacillus alvi]